VCALIQAQRRLLSYLRIHAGLNLLASTAVGAVYYYAAWFKLVNQDYFKTTLAAYGFFPDTLVPVLAWAVPCLEMAVGVSLLFCLHQRAGLLGGTVLSILFTIVVCGSRLRLSGAGRGSQRKRRGARRGVGRGSSHGRLQPRHASRPAPGAKEGLT